jgi:hypothetical protein
MDAGTLGSLSHPLPADIGPEHNSVPVYRAQPGEVTGLPPYELGRWLIVSLAVLSAVPGRPDLLAPATGHPDCVRRDGQIWSVPGFRMNEIL